MNQVAGRRGRQWAAAVATGLVLVGCAADPAPEADDDVLPSTTRTATSSPSDSAASPSRSPSSSPGPGTTITTGPSEFGPMLFDARGQAIYLFDRETSTEPDCYGECAEAWPPVLTTGSPEASGGVRAHLLDTTERADGSQQVTYAGHPLYFYAHESPGQVLCHDVLEFGGLWLVVTPSGTPAP